MAADTRGITAGIVAALRAITTAGGYTYDLSGDDQVLVDQDLTDRVGVIAAVGVYPGPVRATREGVPMGYRGRTGIWTLIGRVKPAAQTQESRTYAAQDLADDLVTALEAGETTKLGQSLPLLRVDVEVEAFGGGGSDAPSGEAYVLGEIRVEWRVRTGV